MVPIATRPETEGAPGPTELPRVDAAVSVARDLVSSTLDGWGLSGITDAAKLIVSELATNAVAHGEGGCMEIEVTRPGCGRVRLAVSDTSKAIPQMAAPTDDATGGRGLHLVEALSQSWGTELHPDKKIVWAEVTLHPRDNCAPERSHPH
ncbi:ATP-binding protein [Streptomyces sp. NPDC087294]|uniref:ATP-binding protein n=1 Tax=Streptomyces sp. NPDC087294 TaxID=3365777 RepID=UPI0037F30F01